jgi:hypothetical protein
MFLANSITLPSVCALQLNDLIQASNHATLHEEKRATLERIAREEPRPIVRESTSLTVSYNGVHLVAGLRTNSKLAGRGYGWLYQGSYGSKKP